MKKEQTDILFQVERAVEELRRGRPVLISCENGACLAVSSELLDSKAISLLKAEGPSLRTILTHPRAKILKIHLYTKDAVAISLPAKPSPAVIHHLADPTSDLGNPLAGPFEAAREPLPTSEIAGVRLAKLAGLLPSVTVVSIDSHGSLPNWGAWAGARGYVSIPASAIDAYNQTAAKEIRAISQITSANVPLDGAEKTRIIAFRPGGDASGGPEHLAIVIGDPDTHQPVLTRLHSECFTGDLIGSLKCDCGQQLRGAIKQIGDAGSGILLYLAQEGRGIGLMNKLRAYKLQEQGFDTVDANLRLGFETDERLFQTAAEILRNLGVSKVNLMTNNPDKVRQLEDCGIVVAERVKHQFPSNPHNESYLAVKKDRTGHLLEE